MNNASAPYHAEAAPKNWLDVIQVDLHGAIYATLHAIPAMRKRNGGAIVNMGSTSAIGHGRKHSKSPGYDVAKMGLIRLTTTLAPLYASDGIRVNCLVPAWIATPEVKSYVDSLTPQQRKEGDVPEVLITLDEISNVVFKLATNETLAGRIMLYYNGQPPRLISQSDPGYAMAITDTWFPHSAFRRLLPAALSTSRLLPFSCRLQPTAFHRLHASCLAAFCRPPPAARLLYPET